MNEKKLIKNSIKCNHCGEVITSKHTHDFKSCKCGTISVDGGLSYARRCFKNSPNDFTDLSEWEEIDDIEDDETEIDDYPSLFFNNFSENT